MATLTNEQIEQKMQQFKKLTQEAERLKNELIEAGAWPLDEDDLDEVAGGRVPRIDPRPAYHYEEDLDWDRDNKANFL